MPVLKLDKNNFSKAIDNGVSLIDFYGDWCGPCKRLAPTVVGIAEERPDLTVGKVNVDDSPELAAKYGIVSIPTLIIFKNGTPVDRLIGAHPRDSILSALDNY